MGRVIPSVMARSQKELDALLLRLSGVSGSLHVDVVDGKFAPSKSLWFDFRLPSKVFSYSAHVMVTNPLRWTTQYGSRFDMMFVQVEAVSDVQRYIDLCRGRGWKVCFALKPETSLMILKKYISSIDAVLVLCVTPGFYGSPFVPLALRKISVLKRWKPPVTVYVDGHMNSETIGCASLAGGDYFIVGSALTLASSPVQAKRELEKIVLGNKKKVLGDR